MRQAQKALTSRAAAAVATFVVLMSLAVVVNADPKGNPPEGNGNRNPGCSESNGNGVNWHNGNPFNNGNHNGNPGCENGSPDGGSPSVEPVADAVTNGNPADDSKNEGNGGHGNPDCNGTGPERECHEDGDHNQGGACDGNERVKDECDGDDPGDPAKGSITLDKSGPAEAHGGEAIEYTFEMTNTGNGAITNLALSDAMLGITHSFKHPLTPHKSVTFSAVYAVPESAAGVMVNEATACGKSQGEELCATDTHTVVIGSDTDIVVTKTVSAESVDPGQTVTYSYEVENTGDGDLSNVTVDDDVLGHIGDTESLAAGETVTFTEDFTVQADSPSENIATACAEGELGEKVCATDSARINILLPAGPRRSSDGKLPHTGFSLILWLASGLNLIALGLAMMNSRRFVKI